MRLQNFDYNLPKELIAQEPMRPRDHSRLLVLRKTSGAIKHKHFYNIIDYLKKGDVLVLNNSKVFPARLIGKKVGTGGKIEVFLLRRANECHNLPISETGCRVPDIRFQRNGEIWQCLLGGRVKEGANIEFESGLKCGAVKNNNDGTWQVGFNKTGKKLMDVVYKIGFTPLPQYIKQIPNSKSQTPNYADDKFNYQTIYADDNKVGSVAAPTAGFHFTPQLIKKIKNKGVEIEYVTLHVGLGTFSPVKTENIKEHKMHSEYVEVDKDVMKNIIKAKKENRRIIAVGTTSVRTLESVFRNYKFRNYFQPKADQPLAEKITKLKIKNFSEWTDIFIYPGYEFKIVDGMITNFHLPKSTLLMLVAAFAGKELVDKAYQTAINKKYRFYSYGDAMLII